MVFPVAVVGAGNYFFNNMNKLNQKKQFLIFSSVIFIFFLFIAGIIISLYLNRENIAKNKNISANLITSTETPTPALVIYQSYTTYFVPVTGFKVLRTNIDSGEIKSTTVKILASDEIEFKKNFPDIKYAVEDDSVFYDDVANSESIGIVKLTKLSPKLKSLSLNKIDILDRTSDDTNYFLKYSTTVAQDEYAKLTDVVNRQNLNRILAMGEIIPARVVDHVMSKKNDYLWPFRGVKDFMAKYDARVATFESALVGTGNGLVCAYMCFDFIANEKFVEGMKYSGIDLVTLADNHSMNGGIAGIGNDIKLLNGIGIKTIGAATTNNEDATAPQIIEINGTKYGFIAYNEIPSVNDWATDTKGGTARVSTNDYQFIPGRVAHDVARAKALGAKFIIAMMHWGSREETNQPTDHQKLLGHHLVDNGVDLVIGDHPHWVMSVEFYKSPSNNEAKFIYYGIGNFVFDQDFSIQTSQGSFAELDFYNDKIISIKIHPHQITNVQPNLIPETDKAYKQVFDRIWQFTGKI